MNNTISTTCLSDKNNEEANDILRVNDNKAGWQNRPIIDLVYIKGYRGYSWLIWTDGSKQIMAYTLKHFASKLPENKFIRIHQNCIVNRHHIDKTLNSRRGQFLRLINGDEVVISRRRWMVIKHDLLAKS